MRFRQAAFLIILIAATLIMASCASGHSSVLSLKSVSVAMGSAPKTLSANSSTTLQVTVSNDAANAGVTWTVTCNSSTQDCGTLSNKSATSATYTAPPVVPQGDTVTITASSVTAPFFTASTSITIEIISVKVDGASSSLQTVATNSATSLTATILNDSANAGLNWTLSCSSTAAGACGTLGNTSTTGATYTAPGVVPPGLISVTAASVTDPTKFATARFKVATLGVTIAGVQSPMQTNATNASLSADVVPDPTLAGVTWSVTCGSAGACGSFSNVTVSQNAAGNGSTTTASYTAPAAVPTGGAVTLTATSVADTTKSASVSVAITPPLLPDGTYVFSISGYNGGVGGSYQLAGSFALTGGQITGGDQDYVDDFNGYLPDTIVATAPAIATTPDGNIQLTVNTGSGNTETFNMAFVSPGTARIIEYDSNSATGRLDFQTTTTMPSGGFAFNSSGMDISTGLPVAFGGVLNIDGAGTISGAGSVFDYNDPGLGITLQKQSFAASTISPPDLFGRIVFNLVPSNASGVAPISLAGYLIDGNRIALIETTDSLNGNTSGVAFAQGANVGTYSKTTVEGNNYVFGVNGADVGSAFDQVAGIITLNSDGQTASGYLNLNDGGFTILPSPFPDAFTGTYTVDATGRVTLTNLTDSGGNFTYTAEMYLAGSGAKSAQTIITVDANDTLAGVSYQQASGTLNASSFNGNYVLSIVGFYTDSTEFNAVGSVNADGVGTWNGFVDLDAFDFGGPYTPDWLVDGSFVSGPPGPPNTLSGQTFGLDFIDLTSANTQNQTPDFWVYYIVDSTKLISIETDSNESTMGVFELQQF